MGMFYDNILHQLFKRIIFKKYVVICKTINKSNGLKTFLMVLNYDYAYFFFTFNQLYNVKKRKKLKKDQVSFVFYLIYVF